MLVCVEHPCTEPRRIDVSARRSARRGPDADARFGSDRAAPRRRRPRALRHKKGRLGPLIDVARGRCRCRHRGKSRTGAPHPRSDQPLRPPCLRRRAADAASMIGLRAQHGRCRATACGGTRFRRTRARHQPDANFFFHDAGGSSAPCSPAPASRSPATEPSRDIVRRSLGMIHTPILLPGLRLPTSICRRHGGPPAGNVPMGILRGRQCPSHLQGCFVGSLEDPRPRPLRSRISVYGPPDALDGMRECVPPDKGRGRFGSHRRLIFKSLAILAGAASALPALRRCRATRFPTPGEPNHYPACRAVVAP